MIDSFEDDELTDETDVGQLVSSDKGRPATRQHTKPCSDCPWRRKSLSGWLGGLSSDQWLRHAHGESKIDCHTLIGAECAGAAIYRRNIGKLCRGPVLRLDKDTKHVFAGPAEFKKHHDR